MGLREPSPFWMITPHFWVSEFLRYVQKKTTIPEGPELCPETVEDGEVSRTCSRRQGSPYWRYLSGSSVTRLANVQVCNSIIEPRHDKTNKMTVRPAKTQISLGIRPV